MIHLQCVGRNSLSQHCLHSNKCIEWLNDNRGESPINSLKSFIIKLFSIFLDRVFEEDTNKHFLCTYIANMSCNQFVFLPHLSISVVVVTSQKVMIGLILSVFFFILGNPMVSSVHQSTTLRSFRGCSSIIKLVQSVCTVDSHVYSWT